MESIAIVGTGIAGLGCAHKLRHTANLTLFEQNDYVGGHTNTITVEEDEKEIRIDTGFMVYNRQTYPCLSGLFDELGVSSENTDMSFSVHRLDSELEWSGTGFDRIFGQRKNILNLAFWKMLLDLGRFNKEALEALADSSIEEMSVAQYIQRQKYNHDTVDLYLLPMMSALWSAPPQTMLKFPVKTLLRFMLSHGLLSMYGKLQWLTVAGGAKQYVDKLIAPIREKIVLNNKVVGISAISGKISVCLADGQERTFDKCIVASHADQAHLMLDAHSFPEHKKLLEPFNYEKNTVQVHTDTTVMPKCKRNWASWNYLLDYSKATTHYWMNSLQRVSDKKNYFVSLNASELVDQSLVLKTISYEHPIFTVEAKQMQPKLRALNSKTNQNLFLCGSYFNYGFHEDALQSAYDVVQHLIKEGERREAKVLSL